MSEHAFDEAEAELDLTEELGEEAPALERPTRRFQGWHRPRKQYIRSKQWAGEIRTLASDLNLAGSKVKYLTLPGEDLLDIRYLHDTVCEPNGMELEYLGFSRSAMPGNAEHASFTTNQAAVKQLPRVSATSTTLYSEVETIGIHASDSRMAVQSSGPFHAINLDLCDGFAADGMPDGQKNIFKTVDVLLSLQGRSPADSLLFVTSRIDGECAAADIRDVFDNLLASNIRDCDAFADELASVWSMGRARATAFDLAARIEATMRCADQLELAR